jgi:hypothetical protein
MKHVETFPDSGAEVYRLVDDPRPVDNIYGEQPYSSRDGTRVALRFSTADRHEGRLCIFDLSDGSLHTILEAAPRLPAFHAWGDYLYYQVPAGEGLILTRTHYHTLETERLAALPAIGEARFLYGTVSCDNHYYAVSVHYNAGGSKVLLFDLSGNRWETLIESDLHFKHEQFSLDGRNRLLVQANQEPGRERVGLGVLEVDGGAVKWLAADRPHTPRPTGHEAWIGRSDHILFSTSPSEDGRGNLWTAGVGRSSARLLERAGPLYFVHVSLSRCGRYWIGDVPDTQGAAIHIGSIETGQHRRFLLSRTAQRWGQLSHTHPYMTADNHWLIYNSDHWGHPQTYGARIPQAFLDSLSGAA